MTAERRGRQRLPWVSMGAWVKVRKGLLSSHWVDVEVVDFSSQGLGLITDLPFKEEERLQLSLKLGTEVGELVVNKVTGLVRHSQPHDKGTMFGLEFEADQGEDVTKSLERIEGILIRHQKLADRLR